MTFDNAMALAGGLAFFLYGMKLCGDSLQRGAGKRMRKVVRRLAGNRIIGLVVGFVTTLVTNSSSATTLIVVSFVGAGLMTLEQGIAVSLGACVGTTVALQLIAFKIAGYALVLVAVGLFASMIFRKETWVAAGTVLFSAGLVFFGIHLMATGLKPLAASESFARQLIEFNDAPLLVFALATVVAVATQSGAATIAMVMALLMNEEAAVQINTIPGIAWVIGANLGTASTGLIGSLRASPDGKRAAVAHVLFKIIGSAICLAVVIRSGWFAGHLGVREMANAHLAFNLINVLLFLPLITPLAWLCRLIIPHKSYASMTADEIHETRIDDALLATPEAALTRTRGEIVTLSGIAAEMIEWSIEAVVVPDGRLVDGLEASDDRIDKKTKQITRFLTALSRRRLSTEMSEEVVRQLSLADDLENIGDAISNDLIGIALKLPKKGKRFSEEDLTALRGYHMQVLDYARNVFRLLVEYDEESAWLLMQRYDELEEHARALRLQHIEHMSRGVRDSQESSAIYLDLHYTIRRISAHARDLVISLAS